MEASNRKATHEAEADTKSNFERATSKHNLGAKGKRILKKHLYGIMAHLRLGVSPRDRQCVLRAGQAGKPLRKVSRGLTAVPLGDSFCTREVGSEDLGGRLGAGQL